MTNSHNRTMGGRNSERNNASPNQYTGSYYGSSSHHRKNTNNRGQQRSPTGAIFFNSNTHHHQNSSSSSSISPTFSSFSSPSRFGRSDSNTGVGGSRGSQPITIVHSNQYHHSSNISGNNGGSGGANYNHQFMSQHRSSPGAGSTSSTASSPPNISLFAGSKCYDAPSPMALPQPPSHWTSARRSASCTIVSKQSDYFSNNLKLMLNVRA